MRAAMLTNEGKYGFEALIHLASREPGTRRVACAEPDAVPPLRRCAELRCSVRLPMTEVREVSSKLLDGTSIEAMRRRADEQGCDVVDETSRPFPERRPGISPSSPQSYRHAEFAVYGVDAMGWIATGAAAEPPGVAAIDSSGGYPALWDWRRRIAALYAEIRAEADPQAAWRHWRATRDRMFRDHPQSAIPLDRRVRFAALPFFDYDPALRFAVDLLPVAAAPLSVEAGHDGALEMRPFARTIGLERELGRELTLYWLAGYCGGVFLPFADATSGRETYGGGRYLLDTIKSADLGSDAGGRVILDFNFSYNPSCSYSADYVCPLSPSANRLPVAVRAGERAPEMG